MFKRAVRLGLVAANPVTGIPKLREPGGRVVYLMPEDETALREALPPSLRTMMTVAVNSGLRWSEQARLQWAHVDVLTGLITVPLAKNGHTRRVPMNAAVRSVLMDVAAGRERPDDPTEVVFSLSYRHAVRLFGRAVERAQAALRDAGKDTSRLEGFTWHGLRHTFASRLVMAGVDLLTVKELGGWRTLAMVQRYAHLAPNHLQAAVERLVGSAHEPSPAAELSRNCPDEAAVTQEQRAGVS
jgi:site-specific recombinase XerD